MEKGRSNNTEEVNGWSRELVYQLLDNVREYTIFVSDPSGRIITWNIGAQLMFGYTPEEAIGMDGAVIFTPEDRSAGVPKREMETALREGCASDERWHIRKDGSRLFVTGFQMPLLDEKGDHTGFAKIARDITERFRISEQLQAAHDLLETKVAERTAELEQTNEQLRKEAAARGQAEAVRAELLRKIVSTQEDERMRVARDIHDHIGQQMTALRLKIDQLQRAHDLGEGDMVEVLEEMGNISERIDEEVDFLIWELRPPALEELGLADAAKQLVQNWSAQFSTPAEFHQLGTIPPALAPETEINLYRILQEALNNTAKHARPRRVSVLLEAHGDSLTLIVEDDGVGFDPSIEHRPRDDGKGLGLAGMRERTELLGGSFEIESSSETGTTIFARVPIN